ncbi:hypothetical protein C5167_020539 [Papaver somniferum]|uniref:Uncharacterized protein n=1 Tax=Papaver somniferum TaxID=3469 RepID=A0A4Y7IXB5_PAPSO|nr:hypothetical protein C5167_020539 [Papaver somniferum]
MIKGSRAQTKLRVREREVKSPMRVMDIINKRVKVESIGFKVFEVVIIELMQRNNLGNSYNGKSPILCGLGGRQLDEVFYSG